MRKSDQRTRTWIFTYYPTDEIKDEIWFSNLSQKKGIRYFIAGKELCPTTDRLHYQGYIAFSSAKTFNATKKWFGLDRIHINPAMGNDYQNQKYCSKEGNLLLEIGTPHKQGKRSDIARAVEIVKETSSVAAVCDEVMNYQAVRHAELYLKYKEKRRPVQPIQVIWIYGSAGKGKTEQVYEEHPDVYQPINFKWWEGYDGHKTVLIDDIRKDFCKFHELLKLTDIYPFRVETKGGSRQVQFNKLYITAPYSPTEMWGTYREDINQLLRRITQTINIDED